VASGVAALLNAIIPLWVVLIDWLRYGSVRPGLALWARLGLGFVGIMLLIAPNQFAGGEGVHLLGAVVLAIGGISWALGSLVARQVDLPKSPSMATGMQLLAGGVMLLILGAAMGELANFQLSEVSLEAVIAVIYLICFPSIVAYSAYVWLMRVSDAARVSTYAYVNPVVAVGLGRC
jgi:drug/metabolite transporter (DMT)-like permease